MGYENIKKVKMSLDTIKGKIKFVDNLNIIINKIKMYNPNSKSKFGFTSKYGKDFIIGKNIDLDNGMRLTKDRLSQHNLMVWFDNIVWLNTEFFTDDEIGDYLIESKINDIKTMLIEEKAFDYKFTNDNNKDWYGLKFTTGELDSTVELNSTEYNDDKYLDINDDYDLDRINEIKEKGISVIGSIIGEENFDKICELHFKQFNLKKSDWDYDDAKVVINKKGKTASLKNIWVLTVDGDIYLFNAEFKYNQKLNKIQFELSDLKYNNKPNIRLEEGKKSIIWDVWVNDSDLEHSIEKQLVPYLESYLSAKSVKVDMFDNFLFDDETGESIEYIINGTAKKSKNQVKWTGCKFHEYTTYQIYTFDFIATFGANSTVEYEIVNFKATNK